MKLTVFQADKGDCLLLTGAGGARLLADGGMAASYEAHVAARLGALRTQGDKLDLIYLSHIDADHISGVLQLLEDEVAWRVHEYQLANGNGGHAEPVNQRPPKVSQLWHNAFHEQVGKNVGAIEDMLAATAATLEAASTDTDRAFALGHRELATSIAQGIELSRRVAPEQLGIPVNVPFAGRLALVRTQQAPVELGGLRLTVIGPFKRDLDKLRREWNTWLRNNDALLERIRERMRQDTDRLGTTEIQRLQRAIEFQVGELGDRSKVTTPNLASLMLLVEEGTKTALLTGDGHHADILAGLEETDRLDQAGCLHLDLLKLQHHGSEFNVDLAFCKRITATNYVICANGAHENPDLRVLDVLIDSRIGSPQRRTRNPAADGPFTVWFNCSAAVPGVDKNRKHMKAVEKLVRKREQSSGGRMTAVFLDDHALEIDL